MKLVVRGLGSLIKYGAYGVIYVLPLWVLFSFFALSLNRFGLSWSTSYSCALVLSLVPIAIIEIFRGNLVNQINKLIQVISESRMSHSFIMVWAIIAIGLVVRLVWFFAFPAEMVSDSATYVELANRLITGRNFETADTFSYWPPGYPLFLYLVHLGSIEVSVNSLLVVNLSLFILTSILIFIVVKEHFSRSSAMVALVIFAIIPSLISLAGLAYKENVIIFLLLLSLRVYFSKGFAFSPIKFCLVGFILGVASLIQPGLLLFVFVFIFTEIVRGISLSLFVKRFFAMLIAMLITISPWTIRNYFVFDEFVLISTNGGSNFYRANNELATGGYIKQGKIDLNHLSELEQNREGSRLAKKWIKENPVDFLQLSFKKTVLFLGDDSSGVYESVKRGSKKEVSSFSYLILKTFSTGFWVLLWLVIWIERQNLKGLFGKPVFLAVSLSFLYFFTIHAVFESNGKYHLPVIWSLIVLVSVVVNSNKASMPNR